ncbi:MAG: hypothetical protein E6J43_13340 [Chloroflexi bacterium]|nr:MAG: hypothetical protein E6J43_13340 [Chloroflexota bacterium]
MRWTAAGRERLERVIGVGQTQTSGDTEVTLLSVEVYNGGFVLNHRIRSLQAKNAMRRLFQRRHRRDDWPDVGVPHVDWEAGDDRGGEYERMPVSSSGSTGESSGSTAFFPKGT